MSATSVDVPPMSKLNNRWWPLPAATNRVEYALEYGTDSLEMHVDALREGDRVVLIDDLMAAADAECQPAASCSIDGRRLLRERVRMSRIRRHHGRAQLDARRRLRERGADDEERGHVPVVHEVVLGRPYRREAKPFRLDTKLDRLVLGAGPVRLAGPELRAEKSKADSHRC